ncbi:MAG: DNA primase [Caulobacterales bacterium 32-69-10]|nr:MAG: DNA primase [Caulobacterales bacterium 32-69-10]
MRFDERFLEEIKTRVRLSDVIGRTVKLRRQGREYVGLSPFAKEKTPSFYVNDEKGFFHDFSSGKHGDLISFWQETERLSFPEAVERLAAEAGVPMPAVDPRAAEVESQRAGLSEWLDTAAKWYEAQLRRPVGAAARTYLAGRALPEEDWARFRLGYAPGGRTALKDYLIAKGANARELIDAGLLIEPEDGGAPYDRFRDRIIFPIADHRGRVISFGGRAMDAEARAKYLNGPETSIFHKGSNLYGQAEARRLLHVGGDGAPIVVVEGYMDVIACQRADIAAVAPMGTALTEEQMERLWRLHPEPTLCFDADKAGLRAASRVIDRALPHLKPGRSFRFALIQGGKDPDDVLREQGAAALKAQILQTKPFVDALFEREKDLEPLDTPEHRAGLKARLRAAAGSIQDKDLAQAYREELLHRLDELFERKRPAAPAWSPPARPFKAGGRGQGGRWRNGAEPPAPPTPQGRAGAQALHHFLPSAMAAVVQAALAHPEWLEPHLEALENSGFGHPDLEPLAREIIRLRLDYDAPEQHEQDGSPAGLDSGGLVRHLAERGYGALLMEIARAAGKSSAPFLSAEPDLTAKDQWSQAFEMLTRMAALESALSAAKAEASQGLDAGAFSRLKAERDTLRRAIKSGTVWGGEGS